MRTLREDREALLEELRRYTDEFVIVEGRHDTEALVRLGFTRVIEINKGKGLYEFSVDVDDARVLVLTDFDPEGERIAKKLDEYLNGVGCRTDRAARERLRALFRRNKLTTVQGLRNVDVK
ncbi:MAG: hypothetical protein HYS81_04245 [Candidatus Aenigmatarchaeota archaeon]|nr:MAG: hypothetical protein HYS81_04245 [Candidatus Aenigmarchaeota archaeon]